MPEPRFSVSAIAEVASTPINGELPLVVGGQAVNAWALAYLNRIGEKLRAFAPFTSKDLDLYGPLKILEDLGKKYGVPVKLSPPRLPGLGHVIIPSAESPLKVELLHGVKGIRKIETQNAVILNIDGKAIRVLDAISCLKAKISNAADLDQVGRQDVKHVQIMKICAREYAKDLITEGNQGRITERLAVNYLENLLETVTSREAQKVEQKWRVPLGNVFPLETIRQSTMGKIKNFIHYQLEDYLKNAPNIEVPRQQPES
jgi:hypothetical protein